MPAVGSNPRRFVPVAEKSSRRCPQLEILEINGAIFFGSVSAISHRLNAICSSGDDYRHVLLVADSVNLVDISGAEFLSEEAQKWRKRGGGLYVCGLKIEDRMLLKRGGYLDLIGKDNIFLSKKQAIAKISSRLDAERCERCSLKLFAECRKT